MPQPTLTATGVVDASTLRQSEIARLAELRNIVNRTRKEFDELRLDALGRLAAGAGTEPGRYAASVSVHHVRRLNKADVAAVLGDARFRDLWSAVVPVETRRLVIRDLT